MISEKKLLKIFFFEKMYSSDPEILLFILSKGRIFLFVTWTILLFRKTPSQIKSKEMQISSSKG